jgi:hypothetical protein
MKAILTSFFLFLSLASVSITHASTIQHLMTVTSDGLEGTLRLAVKVTEHDEATHLILTKDEDKDYRREFQARELARGVVILEKGGHDVVVIRSPRFDTNRGGFVVIDYLSNGVTKARRQVELQIEHDGQKWLVLHQGEQVNWMFMESRSFLGKVVGIRSVKINP